MVLQTNLEHVATAAEHATIIENNENVMICCGRMGPMCLPVYDIMDELKEDYTNVKFMDMLFDSPEASVIRNHPACSSFMGLPFVVYYRNGELVSATTSIQNREQITQILDKEFKN
ncbi:MAG: thioredoxin [Bacteroidota bacterium]